jgi:hypothetical protein
MVARHDRWHDNGAEINGNRRLSSVEILFGDRGPPASAKSGLQRSSGFGVIAAGYPGGTGGRRLHRNSTSNRDNAWW